MDMNRAIPKAGAVIVTATVSLFAVCILADFPFGSYLVCMFLPIGYISCFFMPMTGMFASMAEGNGGSGGGMALLVWCVYFIPIGALAIKHFGGGKGS